MMMDIAIFSVSYPDVEPYFSEYLSSLSKQTDKSFTLFLINDGFPNIKRFLERFDLSVKVQELTGPPAVLRKAGIEWVICEGAEVIVFADADDYFAENRVEVSKKMLADYDVICNELILVGQNIPRPIPMLGEFFIEGMKINARHIKTGNCMGLSNSSIKADKISPLMLEIPDDVIAFDWALFSLCLHAGTRAVFTRNTETYYRQYNKNIASPRSLSEEQILRGVRVKRDHYNVLSKYYDEYIKLSNGFARLYSRLQSDVLLKNKYCKAVRMNSSAVPMWWEPIKPLEELGL